MHFTIFSPAMAATKDYLQEVQKFVSSQYWYSGFRITAGVMVPLFFFLYQGWLPAAIPFLWGSLFVSLTDTPGPIQHRRNGMLAAVGLNTIVVLLTALTREYPVLLVSQIVLASFFLSMLGIYGARAGAVGTLALVVMLLNLLSIGQEYDPLVSSLLIAAGGGWYMLFSMMLHGIQPYRAVAQALGEYLIGISDYIRARAAFYREDADVKQGFNRLMKEHSDLRRIQGQTQELLFKTRTSVSDASPRSRSLMMMYLDSLDLFEQTMYAYQNYDQMHLSLRGTGLLPRYYGVILELAAGLEHVGLAVQMGNPVKKPFDITSRIADLKQRTAEFQEAPADEEQAKSLEALSKIIRNIEEISNRINRLILYTRMEGHQDLSSEMAERASRMAASQPVNFRMLKENFTLKSDNFRHAIRLTIAIATGYFVSLLLDLDHSYWLLLTIVTIMRPAYVLTKKRNVERVVGTLIGIGLVLVIIWTIGNPAVLVVLMILSMLLGYSLLRVNYFSFVVLITIFFVISLSFLNPFEFQSLIAERLIDTVIGSVIAFLASRYIFPTWGHHEIRRSMQKMLEANRQYFTQAWIATKTGQSETPAYALARQDAVVSLTNLSDNFQRMISEPQQSENATPVHQFVIANHLLTGHIAALSDEHLAPAHADSEALEELSAAITHELQCAEDNLRDRSARTDLIASDEVPLAIQSLTHLSMVHALARDIRKITARMK
jgi:uncharacterized membrane protein YccC